MYPVAKGHASISSVPFGWVTLAAERSAELTYQLRSLDSPTAGCQCTGLHGITAVCGGSVVAHERPASLYSLESGGLKLSPIFANCGFDVIGLAVPGVVASGLGASWQ